MTFVSRFTTPFVNLELSPVAEIRIETVFKRPPGSCLRRVRDREQRSGHFNLKPVLQDKRF